MGIAFGGALGADDAAAEAAMMPADELRKPASAHLARGCRGVLLPLDNPLAAQWPIHLRLSKLAVRCEYRNGRLLHRAVEDGAVHAEGLRPIACRHRLLGHVQPQRRPGLRRRHLLVLWRLLLVKARVANSLRLAEGILARLAVGVEA